MTTKELFGVTEITDMITVLAILLYTFVKINYTLKIGDFHYM